MKWPTYRLDQCTDIVSGSTPKTDIEKYWGGDINWATPKDLSNLNKKLISDTPDKITREGYDSCSTQLLPVSSVLFSSRAPIGHVAINSVPMCTNQGFKSFIPKKELLDANYLYYWLIFKREYLQSLGNGATFKEVSKATISRVEIPLPPLEEQRRIAAILDKAEALRAKRREAIAKRDQLLQSLFLEMFVGKDFPEMTVGELALARKGAIRTGPFGSQLLHSEFTDNGIKVLGIDNAVKNTFSQGDNRYISLEKYESLKRYTVYPGDVIITIMGTCGRCAVVPDKIEKSINTKHLCCITLDNKKCNPEYLHSYFLMHPSARKYLNERSKGAIMDGLNMGIIKEMPVACPPIDLQEKYCFIKSKIQNQREKLISFEIEVENLNKSLQHKYFK